MTKITLLLFWALWLLDVLAALYGHREFIMGVFGQHAAPSSTYMALWTGFFVLILTIIIGSLYLKNHGSATAALIVVAIPVALALPYLLWMTMLLILRPDWR